jgi:hypothetical protein
MIDTNSKMISNPNPVLKPKPEAEHTGPIWKHPYLVYVIITLLLFGFLVLMGWLAIHEGWLPNRGTV